jgi:hypothetical protein
MLAHLGRMQLIVVQLFWVIASEVSSKVLTTRSRYGGCGLTLSLDRYSRDLHCSRPFDTQHLASSLVLITQFNIAMSTSLYKGLPLVSRLAQSYGLQVKAVSEGRLASCHLHIEELQGEAPRRCRD